MASTVGELLAAYPARTPDEAVDLERMRALAAAGDPWTRASRLHFTGSAFVVHPPTRRVLLRWHARQQAWLQVGGHGDPGESDPLAVARREAREETGLIDVEPWPDGRLLHAVIVAVPANSTEPDHEHADLRFVLATAAPQDAVAESADAPLRWLGLADARALTAEENLRVTLDRVEALLSTADDRQHDAVDG